MGQQAPQHVHCGRRVCEAHRCGRAGGGPCDVDFTADGRIIVADCGNHRVCIFAADAAAALAKTWDTYGVSDGQFEYPTALAVSGGKLLVLDAYTARVQVFD